MSVLQHVVVDQDVSAPGACAYSPACASGHDVLFPVLFFFCHEIWRFHFLAVPEDGLCLCDLKLGPAVPHGLRLPGAFWDS